jgi:hypothetical protein
MKQATAYFALLLGLVSAVCADSLYDLEIFGRDVVPSTGISRTLGGATAANPDAAAAYITSPAASAFADQVILQAAIVQSNASSTYDDQQKSSATSIFPAVSVIIPLRVVNLFSGYFVERLGRAGREEDGIAYGNAPFNAAYTKESSVFSVPIFLSAAYRKRLAVSGGVVFSYLDSRETREIDFTPTEYTDTDDAVDSYANGTSWALGALFDYDYVRVGGSIRTSCEMSGREEYRNDIAELWRSDDLSAAAPGSYKVGIALVTKPVEVEFDYETSPWSKLKLNDKRLSINEINRSSLGIIYKGRSIWNGARFPLMLGFYSQPLDRPSESDPETTERGYLAGTSLDIAKGRATVVFGLEYITRDSAGASNRHEEVFGFHLSVSVQEAWRRAMRR